MMQSKLYSFLTNPKLRVCRHILLIITFALVSFNQASYRYENYSDLMGNYLYAISALSCIVYLSYVYINLYFFVPHFLLKKRYKAYLTALFCMLLIHLTYEVCLEYIIQTNIKYTTDFKLHKLYLFLRGLVSYTTIFMCMMGTTVTALFKHRMLENRRMSKMEQEHLKSELDRLKEQISPSFLSNILNKTSVLTKTEPQKASEMLMRLGQLLRYQLYDCNRDKVLLSAEIKFLKKYLELEQLYCNQFKYKFVVDASIKEAFVSPLLFIPFIQQSANQLQSNGKVISLDLHFRIEKQNLIFTCQSNYDKILSSSELFAIKKRLNLIYPDTYSLSVNEGITTLQLNNVAGL